MMRPIIEKTPHRRPSPYDRYNNTHIAPDPINKLYDQNLSLDGRIPIGKGKLEYDDLKHVPDFFEYFVQRPLDFAIRQINAETGCNYKLVELVENVVTPSPFVSLTFTAVDGDDVTVQTLHATVRIPFGVVFRLPHILHKWRIKGNPSKGREASDIYDQLHELQFPFEERPTLQDKRRHALKVYVGGLPPSGEEQTVGDFFDEVLGKIGGKIFPGCAVVSVYINREKKFAFLEMRSVREASNAMALDGILFKGSFLKVRRPSNYYPVIPSEVSDMPSPSVNLEPIVAFLQSYRRGLDGPDCIFVGGLPNSVTDAETVDLLESCGALRAFKPIKDRETGNSKGYAFCTYNDLSVTDFACARLNGRRLGDRTITVRRANCG